MQGIEDLRGVHAGSDVWVIGASAALDFFPEAFFDERVTIGVNHVSELFPVKYIVSKADAESSAGAVERMARAHPETTFVVSRHEYGKLSRPEVEIPLMNVRVFSHRHNRSEAFSAASDIPVEEDHLLVSQSTFGSAMHFGAVLGARSLFLVGNDGGLLEDRLYSRGYPRPSHRQPSTRPWSRFFRRKARISEWDARVLEVSVRQSDEIGESLGRMYGCSVVNVLPFPTLRLGGRKFASSYAAINDRADSSRGSRLLS